MIARIEATNIVGTTVSVNSVIAARIMTTPGAPVNLRDTDPKKDSLTAAWDANTGNTALGGALSVTYSLTVTPNDPNLASQ